MVREHDRLLMGGIWAEVTLRYDDILHVQGPEPAVLHRAAQADPALDAATSSQFSGGASAFTRDEWLDLLHALAWA